MSRRPALVAAVAVTACLAGCTAAPTTVAPPSFAPATSAPAATSATATTGPPAACGDPAASYDPLPELPPPGRMPAGTPMARIADRGRLVVGTAGDKPLLAARDARGELQGIDVDLAREVARAILGSPDKVEFRTIPYAGREPALRERQVDMVAHSMTMTCDRWERISFSSTYYRDGQRVLVRSDAPVKEIEDLSGSRICVARGTTTIDNLNRLAVPGLEIVSVLDAADCLVLFQDGEVDAITSNEIILRGYLTQDPYAAIVGRDLSDEPRGLAFHEADVDLVRFTNAVLAGLRRDGRLAQILQRHLRAVGVTVGRDVTVPEPAYGRRP